MRKNFNIFSIPDRLLGGRSLIFEPDGKCKSDSAAVSQAIQANVDLRSADLSSRKLKNLIFPNWLREVDFSDATLDRCRFPVPSVLEACRFHRTKFSNTNPCVLSFGQFNNNYIRDIVFSNIRLDLSSLRLMCLDTVASGLLSTGPHDGYMVYMFQWDKTPYVRCGCRWFDLNTALRYWQGKSDRVGILNGVRFLAKEAKRLGWAMPPPITSGTTKRSKPTKALRLTNGRLFLTRRVD